MVAGSPPKSIFTFQFWLLCASSFLFFASFNMLIPELPGYLDKMGGGAYKGWIIAIFTVTAGISRPFSGKLTDQWGRIPVMIFGVSVCVVAGLLYPYATTVFAFLGVRLLHGFSTGFKPTATSAIIGDIVPDHRRGEALGYLSMFGTTGMGTGPILGPWITQIWNIQALFLTSSVIAALSLLILLGMKETLAEASRFHVSMLKVRRHEIFATEAWPPSIVMVLSVFGFGVMLTLAPDLSLHLGLPEAQKGIFFTVFTFSSVLVRVLAGKLSDRFGRVYMLRWGMLLLAISILIIATAQTVTHFLIGAMLIGFSVGNNSPTLFAWVIDCTPAHVRGRGIATLYILLEIGIGSGALISGYVFANQVENLTFALLTPAPLVLLALLYLFVGVKRDSPPTYPQISGANSTKTS